MINLDSNIILRFVVQDNRAQYEQVRTLFESLSSAHKAYISDVAIAETIWVMRKAYRIPNETIVELLTTLVNSPVFAMQKENVIRDVLNNHNSKADLSDELIHHLGVSAGCTETVTFDKAAAKHIKGVRLLDN